MTGLSELNLVGPCPLLGVQLAERIQAAGINVQVMVVGNLERRSQCAAGDGGGKFGEGNEKEVEDAVV